MTARPTTPAAGEHRRWTADDIRALGTITDVPTAGQILGLSRNHAYQLARDDQFPVPVLRVGSRFHVPVAHLLAALGLPP
jgi:predicted DNA-binding transcriptional regulator AlpA